MGTRSAMCQQSYPNQDHPHAYGDKVIVCDKRSPSQGSSPRVWGQVYGTVDLGKDEGIIPTRMGTRYDWFAMTSKVEDHPHAYGDKTMANECQAPEVGSSPRVWGQVIYPLSSSSFDRIIPTRMGTRQNMYISYAYERDHPHAYGDKQRR